MSHKIVRLYASVLYAPAGIRTLLGTWIDSAEKSKTATARPVLTQLHMVTARLIDWLVGRLKFRSSIRQGNNVWAVINYYFSGIVRKNDMQYVVILWNRSISLARLVGSRLLPKNSRGMLCLYHALLIDLSRKEPSRRTKLKLWTGFQKTYVKARLIQRKIIDLRMVPTIRVLPEMQLIIA